MRSSYALLACALLQAAVVGGCGRRSDAATSHPSDPPFRTVAVQHGHVVPSVTLAGLIAPLQNVTISSSLQEPADTVSVNEGDYVHAGQVLAQLDTADLRANYDAAARSADDATARVSQSRYQAQLALQQGRSDFESAKTALAQAQQKLSLSQVTLQRDQQLYAQGYLSHQVLDSDTTQYETDRQSVVSARATLQTAEETVRVNGTSTQGLQQENVVSALASAASARAQAKQIAVQISKATIVSPVDGIVVNRNLNPGQYPGSSMIFTVQEIHVVYAMLNASSDQVFLIQQGTPATITVAAVRSHKARGVVEAVLGQAQPGSTNFTVKVRIPNADRVLQPGMVVSADIALPPVSGPMIPTSAYVDASHDAVRVQNADGTTRIVTVRNVADDGSNSIVQGLGTGARVVLQQQ